MTSDQLQKIAHADCNVIMRLANFDYERRRVWTIWASRHQACEKCEAPAFSPCINLNKRYTANVEVPTRNPHEGRVDWVRFLSGLEQRGFVKRG